MRLSNWLGKFYFGLGKARSKRVVSGRRRTSGTASSVERLEERVVMTTWTGDIPNGTVWATGQVQQIIGNVHVPAGATLTIQPGAVVKFNEFGNFSLTVDGTLNAQGTVGQPIYFTTLRDDSVGGDTQGNGPGDVYGGQWNALIFNSTSTSNVLDHVEVRYGGQAGTGSVIVNGGPLTLTNSTVLASSASGVRIQNSNPTLTNILFKDNSVAASMDLNSNPAISGVTMTNNGRNALLVDGGTMTNGGTWNDPNITYMVQDAITVPTGKTLTIAAGQVVKFREFGNFGITVNGTLAANGTVGAPIYFTTTRDDSVGGDTYNNGLSDSYGGQWDALTFNSTSLNNVLDHVEVRYGGESGVGAVVANGGPLTLTNSKLSSSSASGIRILNSNPTLTNITFQSNSIAASMDLNSNPAISGVTMTNNGTNALRVDGGTMTNGGTWNDPNITYLVQDAITVPVGKTLAIAAGQVIKFREFGNFGITVNGTLTANGTAVAPIYFTTTRDDTIGSDAYNNPGSDAYGSQWDALTFNNTSAANVLDHVELRYGGENGVGMVVDNGGPLTLTNSKLVSSGASGIRILNSNPTLTNITFQGNSIAASMDLNSNPAISGVTMTNNGTNALRVDGGTMTNGGTWNDPNITYLVQDAITVPVGKTLTIAAGQVIKFREFGNFGITVNGTLAANGTAVAPIYFTTTRDDTIGTDAYNNPGSDAYGGQWDALTFNNTSAANVLDHVELRYGGENGVGMVVDNGGPLTLTNSKLMNSSVAGVRILNSNPVLTNLIFQANVIAARMDLNSNPAITGVTMTSNSINALLVDGGVLTNGGVWDDPDVTYLVQDAITVPVDKTLSISAGQVVKFREFAGAGITVNGTLTANGAFAAPIYFVSTRDDSVGGDTYNNGPSDAYQGQWNSLSFTSSSTGNLLDHVRIRQGGANSAGTVVVTGSDLTLSNSIVQVSATHGIVAKSNSDVDLVNNLLLNNLDTGVRAESGATVTVTNNTIDGNYRGAAADAKGTSLVLVNNLITNNTNGGIVASNRPAVTASYNDVFNPNASLGNYNGLASATGTLGNISADPKYVNRATLDFHLQTASPVIDAGTSTGAPLDDLDFNFRVDNVAVANTGAGTSPFFDMGAYEFGGRPRAVKSAPSGKVADTVSQIVFSFRGAMDTSSFSLAADVVSFTGPTGALTVTGFQWLNKYQLKLTFAERTKAGDYQLVIGPNILDASAHAMDTDGDGTPGENPGDRYTAAWTIVPPRIVSASAADYIAAPINHIDFKFDRPMDQDSFDLSDVLSFTGPNGAISVTGFSWTDARTLSVTFSSQTVLGFYEMVLGPNISDLGGNLLDQSGNGVAGEATADRYTADFTLANVLFVSGNISQNTTWGGLVIVEGNVTVQAGVTLTINPGTIVKFDDDLALTVLSGATLLANGTAAQPIRFTSIHDDTVGGDSDHNGSTLAPNPGDWSQILNQGTATFDHSQVLYGSGIGNTGLNSGAIRNNGGVLAFSNGLVTHALYDGIDAVNGSVTVTNSVISDTDRGMVSTIGGTLITVINSTIDGNRIGVYAHAGGNITLKNSLVTNSLESGFDSDSGPQTVTNSDIFTSVPNAANYRGLTNATGTNGNISVNPKYVNADNGDYRLNFGSPAIDAANGTVAPTTDQAGAPRYDDPRTANTGTITGNNAFADMGAFEFVEGAASNLDLVVTSVSSPVTAMEGDTVTVNWTEKNVGSAVAGGAWHDAIYLSADGVLTSDDILIGDILHDGNLGSNQSYSATADLTIPGLLPGSYYVLVRANSDNAVFEGANLTNNVTASSTTIALDVPTLTIGTPLTGHLENTGDFSVYKLVAPAGGDVRVSLDGPNGVANELYVKLGDVPTRQSFDARGVVPNQPDQTAGVTVGNGGTFYVMVYGTSLPVSESFTLSATVPGFSISSVSPAIGANSGLVTISFAGSNFNGNSHPQLVDAANSVIEPTSVYYTDSSLVSATFDLTGRPIGLADARIVNPGNVTTTLTDGFSIVAGQPAHLTAHVITPENVRLGRTFSITIEYQNDGQTDMLAPVLRLDGTAQSLLSLSSDMSDPQTSLYLVATNSSGPAGILPPGATGRITVYSRSFGSGATNFTLSRDDSTGLIDWASIGASIRPTGLTDPEWATLLGQIRSQIGEQWSDYRFAISRDATLLSPEQGLNYYLPDVLQVEFDNARAALGTAVSGHIFLNDALHPLANASFYLFDKTQGIASDDVTSRSDGSFVIASVEPGTYDVILEGYALATPIQITVGSASVSSVQIFAKPGASIEGAVLLAPTGEALGAITVHATSGAGDVFTANATDDGLYAFTGLPDGTYTITAGGDPYTLDSHSGIAVVNGSIIHNVNLTLSQGATITGKVTGPGGAAVSGASVTALLPDGTGVSALTDAAGIYHLAGLAAGTYQLVGRANGLSLTNLNNVVVAAGAALTGQNLALTAAGSVTGTMTKQGSPVPFLVFGLVQNGQTVYITQADQAGHYSLPGVQPGVYTWMTTGTGYLSATGQVTVSANQAATVNVSLATSGQVSGTVTDTNGQKLAGLSVNIISNGNVVDTNATDADGHYAFGDLPLGTYTVAVVSDDFSTPLLQHSVTVGTGSEVTTSNFQLAAAQTITGHTYEADGVTPEYGAIVRLLSGTSTVAQTTSDPNGQYSFTVFKPGSYSIFATGGSYPVQSITVGGSTPMTVNLVQGNHNVNGVITDQSTGQPISGAAVQLSLPGRNDYLDLPSGTTASDGSFTVPGMAAGTYDARIVGSNNAVTYSSVNVQANGNTTFSMALKPGSTVTGHVTDPANQSNSDATISVYTQDNHFLGSTQTDDNGMYSFGGLDASQSYFLLIDDGQNQQRTFNAVQPANNGGVLNVQLPAAAGQLQGQVQSGGANLSGSIVIATDSQGRTLGQAPVAVDGTYNFKTLAPGAVKLQVQANGYPSTTSVDATVPLNGTQLEPTVDVGAPAAASGNHTPQQQDLGNASKFIDPNGGSLPALGAPPVATIPVGCEAARDAEATLHYVTQQLRDAIALAMEGNTGSAAAADWGIVAFKINDIAGDLVSGAAGNPGGLIPKAAKAGTALLNKLKNFNLAKAGLFAATQQLQRAATIMTLEIPALVLAMKNSYERATSASDPNTALEILTDITQNIAFQISKLLLDAAALFSLVVKDVSKAGVGLGKILGSELGNVLSVVSLIGDVAEFFTEFGNAIHGAPDRSQAETLARFEFALARAKEERARAALATCIEQHKGNPASFAPTHINPIGTGTTNTVAGHDPNDKIGPAGVGQAGFIQPGLMPYEVEFENDPQHATAAVQIVVVTDTLDADVDVSSLQFTGFGFGSLTFTVPAGLSNYQTTIDLRPEGIDLLVPVDLAFNPQTRVLTATFQTLDPVTGLPPDDPFAGFLPINNANHDGEGFITYTLQPKAGLSTGTAIDNQASIVFDLNDPIVTPTTHNTLDVAGPTSSVSALPSLSSAGFQVQWSGTDDVGGSGIASYDIYVSDNNGDYTLWQAGTAATSAIYSGVGGHTYRFYSVAHDNVGHIEVAPSSADATTATETNTAPSIPSGQTFNVAGNATANTVVGSVTATDADQTVPNKTKSFSITSGNATGAFAINAATGQITVANAGALTALAGQTATLQITVTDGGTPVLSAVQNVSVTVAAVNTAPVLANPGSAPTFVAKLKTPVKVTPTLTVTDADGAATLATVVISLPVGSAKKNPDLVSLPGLAALGTSTNVVTAGRLQITITLKEGATNAAVQTMLDNMTFTTKGAGLKVLSRSFQIRVTDRTGLQSNLITQNVTVKKK